MYMNCTSTLPSRLGSRGTISPLGGQQENPLPSAEAGCHCDPKQFVFAGSPNGFRGGGIQHQAFNGGGTPNRGFQPFRRGSPQSEPMPRGNAPLYNVDFLP